MKVLDLGCGNSKLLEEMYDQDGFRDLVGVDISPAVIQNMAERNKNRSSIQCKWVEGIV